MNQRWSYFICLLLLGAHPCFASDNAAAPSHLMIGIGAFDFDHENARFMTQLEYRWEVHCYHLRPLVTASIATDRNFFLGGGLGWDLFLGKRIVITPSFAPGLYSQGHGKKLGFPVNFRSGIDIAVVLQNQSRIGVQCNHISNAHLLYKNPGANSFLLFYAIPLPHKKASGK